MQIGDMVEVNSKGYGNFSAMISQTYEVPYVTVIDYNNNRYYVSINDVTPFED